MGEIRDAIVDIINKKKNLREITQRELAKKLGCSPPFLCSMLKGDRRISADMLVKLCSALEIKLSDLENWNPELAKIRLFKGSDPVPPELAKARAKLDKLYEVNKPAFDGVIGTIDVWLKQSKEPESASTPELEKKAMAS